MILWPCAVCGSTEYCFHREHDLVAFAIALAGQSAEVIPDPLPEQPLVPLRKPPAQETGSSARPAMVRGAR